jgi:glucose/arabinose dehydrogenase
MLFVSNGETHNSDLSQDPQALGGKVYRYTSTGDIPDDNPFPGSPAFSIGHRNPFGLAIDPITDTPWVTENGPGSFDEINRIEAGRNYGWPVVSGPDCATATELDDCVDPAISYESVIVPTGIAFAPADAPSEVAGHLFFGAYGVPAIHELTLDGSREEVVSDDLLAGGESSIVAVAWGPEGLYYSTTTAVKLIRFASGASSSSATPQTTPTPSPSPGDEGGGGSTVGFVVVILVLLALYGASRRRLTR